MYVLENTGANPMSGTWTERGRVVTPRDSFESFGDPGRYVRRIDGLAFVETASSADERSEATFLPE